MVHDSIHWDQSIYATSCAPNVGPPTPEQASYRHCVPWLVMANLMFLRGTPMRPAGSLDLGECFYFTKARSADPTMGKQGSSNSWSPNCNSIYQFQALLSRFTFKKFRSPYILNCYTTIKFQNVLTNKIIIFLN